MIDRSDLTTAVRWDGRAMVSALCSATEWLAANRDRINALNVFPVPDGDTGTNMVLTMRSAVDEATTLANEGRPTAALVASRAAYGALMGARGNSGVILSQILRGLARGIEGQEEIDGRDLARALAGARDLAYDAVMQPVEGTMLTVIRVAAERASAAAAHHSEFSAVIAAGLEGAREALAATPEMLDILRQAGVVDAGGQGLVIILEALDCVARGQPLPTAAPAFAGPLGADLAFLDRIDELHGEEPFGYCTNFMIVGRGIDFPRVRADLAELGRSAVIVGDDTVVKVHIHALNPGQVLDYALKWGELGQIKIDNMSVQTEALPEERRRAGAAAPPAPLLPSAGRQAVLAVSSGAGLAAALRSMGASTIVAGGRTMNPSVDDLLTAVESADADEVILLPNDANTLLAANHLPDLTAKRVRIVPSRTIAQGIAALSAFNTGADLNANAAAMTASLSAVRTIEIFHADKDAAIGGLTVQRGQVIGLLDEQLVAAGDDAVAVTCETLLRADLDAAELVTIFAGEGARTSDTKQIEERITGQHAGVAVEVYDGGQPHYCYIIAVE